MGQLHTRADPLRGSIWELYKESSRDPFPGAQQVTPCKDPRKGVDEDSFPKDPASRPILLAEQAAQRGREGADTLLVTAGTLMNPRETQAAFLSPPRLEVSTCPVPSALWTLVGGV